MSASGPSYRDAGVDVEAGDRFAAGIGDLAARTTRPEVISGIGGFAGLFSAGFPGLDEPVLVSGTDGVGTKLMLAQQTGKHTTIGIDLVAMCVNDVLCVGAEPLFFLDYYATGRLEPGVGKQVLAGIVEGCEQAGCALLGGETAEMPGMYSDGKYDLAGFCVAVVDRPRLIDGTKIVDGDVMLGIASSGVHSNGFSLVRHVLLEREGLSLDAELEGIGNLGDALLTPTTIYVRAVKAALAAGTVHGIAHVTGGGLDNNVARVVPDGLVARFDASRWEEPAIFGLLRGYGVPDEEMNLTFNRGLGMVLAVPADDVDAVVAAVQGTGHWCGVVGQVETA